MGGIQCKGDEVSCGCGTTWDHEGVVPVVISQRLCNLCYILHKYMTHVFTLHGAGSLQYT